MVITNPVYRQTKLVLFIITLLTTNKLPRLTLRLSGGAERRPLQPVVRPALFELRLPARRRHMVRRLSRAPHVVVGEDRENKRLRFKETSQVAQGQTEKQQPVLIDEHLRVFRFVGCNELLLLWI